MDFYIRKRSRPPTIIIVALIDILVVLVVFLVVTTTFKDPILKLDLPESRQATKVDANVHSPFVLFIDEKGILRTGADAHEVSAGRLSAELTAAVNNNPELRLFIRADKMAPFGQVVTAVDTAKETGVKFVSAFTKEPVKP